MIKLLECRCISDEEIISIRSIWSKGSAFHIMSDPYILTAFLSNRVAAFKAILDAMVQMECTQLIYSVHFCWLYKPARNTPSHIEMMQYFFSCSNDITELVHIFLAIRDDPQNYIIQACAKRLEELEFDFSELPVQTTSCESEASAIVKSF